MRNEFFVKAAEEAWCLSHTLEEKDALSTPLMGDFEALPWTVVSI